MFTLSFCLTNFFPKIKCPLRNMGTTTFLVLVTEQSMCWCSSKACCCFCWVGLGRVISSAQVVSFDLISSSTTTYYYYYLATLHAFSTCSSSPFFLLLVVTSSVSIVRILCQTLSCHVNLSYHYFSVLNRAVAGETMFPMSNWYRHYEICVKLNFLFSTPFLLIYQDVSISKSLNFRGFSIE